MTLDYLVILLLLGLGIVALGYILEARSREAGVDLDGIRLRPWAADKYAGREALRAAGLSEESFQQRMHRERDTRADFYARESDKGGPS